MTCAEARPWLALRQPLPLEAGAGLTAQLAEHVHGCTACTAFTGHASAFDAAVGKMMRDVPMPCGLKARLLIRAENERRARSRQRLFRVAAPLAACLLIGVLFGHFRSQQLPNTPIQLVEVQRWVETDLEKARHSPISPYEARRNLPASIRDRWNLDNSITDSYQAQYQGSWVTVLEVRRGKSHAVIVLLPPERIEPQQMQHFPARYDNEPRVVIGNPEQGEYHAFVMIRSGQINDFLKPPQLPSGA